MTQIEEIIVPVLKGVGAIITVMVAIGGIFGILEILLGGDGKK